MIHCSLLVAHYSVFAAYGITAEYISLQSPFFIASVSQRAAIISRRLRRNQPTCRAQSAGRFLISYRLPG
jgi:hypothetical protein